MKRILLAGFTIAALSIASMSHADFLFQSNTAIDCKDLAGQWSGSGKVKNPILNVCTYSGVGYFSAVDAKGNFSIDGMATKTSGSALCPKQAVQRMKGTCIAGKVVFVSDYGNLNGNFTQNAGTAAGTITVMPGVVADVALQFKKVG